MLPLVVAFVADNASMSVTAPDGYRDASAEVVRQAGSNAAMTGAIVLVTGTAGTSDVASINFVASKHHPEDQLDSLKECTAFAAEMATRQHGEHPTSAIVLGPTGKTCQIAAHYPAQKALVTSTIVRGPHDTWMMTCTWMDGNTTASKQCAAALASIKFK